MDPIISIVSLRILVNTLSLMWFDLIIIVFVE
jgi:hypothetical protein